MSDLNTKMTFLSTLYIKTSDADEDYMKKEYKRTTPLHYEKWARSAISKANRKVHSNIGQRQLKLKWVMWMLNINFLVSMQI